MANENYFIRFYFFLYHLLKIIWAMCMFLGKFEDKIKDHEITPQVCFSFFLFFFFLQNMLITYILFYSS